MNDAQWMDLVFQALASRTRRRMMDIVRCQPGCSVSDLCSHFAISRIAVMKHLKLLVGAKIILSTKRGRQRELFFNAAAIQMIYDRWTTEYSAFWVTQTMDLKYKVESRRKTAKGKKPNTAKKAPRSEPQNEKRNRKLKK